MPLGCEISIQALVSILTCRPELFKAQLPVGLIKLLEKVKITCPRKVHDKAVLKP